MMDGKEEENKTGEINQPQQISVEEKKRDEGWCNLIFGGGGGQQVFRFPSSASPWKPTDPKLSAPPPPSRLENLGTNQEPSTSPLLLLFNGPPLKRVIRSARAPTVTAHRIQQTTYRTSQRSSPFPHAPCSMESSNHHGYHSHRSIRPWNYYSTCGIYCTPTSTAATSSRSEPSTAIGPY